MAQGVVERWSGVRDEGSIRTSSGEIVAFSASDLADMDPTDVHRGMAVEYEPGEGATARRVRNPFLVSHRRLAPPPELPSDHPVFRQPPVPERLARLLSQCDAIHPGLRLDKFLAPVVNQEEQKERLRRVANDAERSAARTAFEAAAGRRRAMLRELDSRLWSRTTSGSLTLHLARASMLENAGICLHAIHGFPYLPGTGLKGLAHAYAETVWKAGEADSHAARATIARIFGRINEGDDQKAVADATGRVESKGKQPEKEPARAGTVVFHDAWPETWPKLDVDVINNHHSTYYEQGEPPGDWDSPKLVYFLAVPAGQSFQFALSTRAGDADRDDLEQAKSWLDAGLTHLGCGAKTAAGYGRFVPEDRVINAVTVPGRWAGELVRLRLITPAFLAGADQGRDDCELRSATLRGLLRWWWRTLHAGYVDLPTLRRLEAALWGNTETGGAIQLAVAANPGRRVSAFAYKDRFRPKADFKREHRLSDPPDAGTTQGLFYAAYGMDDKKGQPPRNYVEPGAAWDVSLQARATRFNLKNVEDSKQKDRQMPTLPIACEQVLDQGRVALWLLATFGGVGSKGRKGFGSLELLNFNRPADLGECEAIAADLRRSLGVDGAWSADRSLSSSLGERLPPIEIATTWTDPWYALDQLGFAYQGFAQEYAHDSEKLALGLPRQIHGPRKEPMPHQREHKPPLRLRAGKLDRHASPVHLHVGRGPSGLILRVLALPSPKLPDRPRSVAFLTHCVEWLRDDLDARARQDPSRQRAVQSPPATSRQGSFPARDSITQRSAPTVPTPPAPKPINKGQQDRVGTLQHQGTGWAVRFEGDAMPATLINPEKLPSDLADGAIGLFYIVEANKTGIRARFDRLAKK
jgi:CRISPR-associated protein Cmr6